VLRRYVTVDVFTDRLFGGNPLAVVLDATGLSTAQMQLIAAEFHYSETTFVLPPRDPHHTAQVRIFTPRVEVPFAGHPNVGTALVLGRELEKRGDEPPETLLFEEGAGLVAVRLLREGPRVGGAEFTAPQSLSVGATVPVQAAAECLMLRAEEIVTATHPPMVLSVGLPFLVVEVSRDSLRRCQPDLASHRRVLPPVGTDAVFAYGRGAGPGALHARMFSPLDAMTEDPATGSAAAALVAHLAALAPDSDAERAWRIEQGVEMGRPSLILGRTVKRAGAVREVHVGGGAVPVMQGMLQM